MTLSLPWTLLKFSLWRQPKNLHMNSNKQLPNTSCENATLRYRNASVNSSGAHPPPGQPRGICSNVCPGGGALAILSQPGGWALAYPGATPGHLTHVFLNMEEFVGKDEDFVKDWLVRHGLEKLVDVFKSMFSQF